MRAILTVMLPAALLAFALTACSSGSGSSSGSSGSSAGTAGPTSQAPGDEHDPTPPPAHVRADDLAVAKPSGPPPNVSSMEAGDRAPEFTIRAPSGADFSLDDLDRPLVINFYRGNWCVYGEQTFKRWIRNADGFRDAGATVVFISPESTGNLKYTYTYHDLHPTGIRVYTDPDGAAARAFGLEYEVPANKHKAFRQSGADLSRHNESSAWRLPHPATFVIDATGTIRYIYAAKDHTVRADPDDVLEVVRRVNSRMH